MKLFNRVKYRKNREIIESLEYALKQVRKVKNEKLVSGVDFTTKIGNNSITIVIKST